MMLSLVGLLQLLNTLFIQLQLIGIQKTSICRECTDGSEFVAAKTATEQIIKIRQTSRYFGVPIKSRAFILGDISCHQFNNPSFLTEQEIQHVILPSSS